MCEDFVIYELLVSTIKANFKFPVAFMDLNGDCVLWLSRW